MKGKEPWLSWASELQSLAQAGLYYGKDKFDLERYARIREISAEMMAHQTGLPLEQVRNIFCCETGYQTPKLATRAAVIQGDKVLLVREPRGWALPGGWVDYNVSVRENVGKEVREEAGLEVRPERVIGLQDGENHHVTAYPWKVCIVFVLCTLLGGEFRENLETSGSGWFSLDELPELDLEKTTPEQLSMCFEASRALHWETILE